MLRHYGKRWLDQWAQLGTEEMIEHWAQGLAMLSPAELVRGCKRLDQCTWPPTLPEFRQLCRSAQDYEAAFYEAVREMYRRRDGLDEWSEPAVFWAAVRMGVDLSGRPYEQLRNRWREAVDTALADIRSGKLADEVPAARPAMGLPPPAAVRTEESKAVALDALAALRARFGAG